MNNRPIYVYAKINDNNSCTIISESTGKDKDNMNTKIPASHSKEKITVYGNFITHLVNGKPDEKEYRLVNIEPLVNNRIISLDSICLLD